VNNVATQNDHDDLNKRVNLIDYLGTRGHSPVASEDRVFYYCCPMPGHADKGWTFEVDTTTNTFECLLCIPPVKGGAVEMVVGLDGISPVQAAGRLRRFLGEPSIPVTQRTEIDDFGTLMTPAVGCSLQALSQAKGIPVEFLMECGWDDMTYSKRPAVRIPYQNENGETTSTRYRINLTGSNRFTWKTGDKPGLYGLSRFEEARGIGSLPLVPRSTGPGRAGRRHVEGCLGRSAA
jgi:hypothetical protein